uniref:Uncharacterized protein n=1 Tax=viral metagenome TaxID=1070528 RepID=A0A6H2A2C0_9ZZZZ
MIGEFIHAHKFLIGLLAGGFVGFWAGIITLFLAYEWAKWKIERKIDIAL